MSASEHFRVTIDRIFKAGVYDALAAAEAAKVYLAIGGEAERVAALAGVLEVYTKEQALFILGIVASHLDAAAQRGAFTAGGMSTDIQCLKDLWVEIEPLLFGAARVIVTDGVNVVRQWAYRDMPAAEAAVVAVGKAAIVVGAEPPGWFRRIM